MNEGIIGMFGVLANSSIKSLQTGLAAPATTHHFDITINRVDPAKCLVAVINVRYLSVTPSGEAARTAILTSSTNLRLSTASAPSTGGAEFTWAVIELK